MQLNNQILKISGIGALILMAMAVGFHFFISVPSQQAFAEKKYRQERVDKCLVKAEESFMPNIQRMVAGIAEGGTPEMRAALPIMLDNYKAAQFECEAM